MKMILWQKTEGYRKKKKEEIPEILLSSHFLVRSEEPPKFDYVGLNMMRLQCDWKKVMMNPWRKQTTMMRTEIKNRTGSQT